MSKYIRTETVLQMTKKGTLRIQRRNQVQPRYYLNIKNVIYLNKEFIKFFQQYSVAVEENAKNKKSLETKAASKAEIVVCENSSIEWLGIYIHIT